MVKTVTLKCIFLSILVTPYTLNADNHKKFQLRSLGGVVKVKKQSTMRKDLILEKINELVGDDIDLTLFDKKRSGLSVYAKISRVSKLGVRYRF